MLMGNSLTGHRATMRAAEHYAKGGGGVNGTRVAMVLMVAQVG